MGDQRVGLARLGLNSTTFVEKCVPDRGILPSIAMIAATRVLISALLPFGLTAINCSVVQAEPEAADSIPAEAAGDALDLEALLHTNVEVATKRSQSLEEAPAVVSVVTEQEIRERGYFSVAEALRALPGFYLVDDYVLPNVGVRGIPGGQRAWSRSVKIMIDGMPVPYRPDATHFLGPELVPMELIKRIEVVRGPGSALYGADAFLGVVNIITRRGDDIAGGQLSATGGQFMNQGQFESGLLYGETHPEQDAEWVVAAALSRFERSGLQAPAGSPLSSRWAASGAVTRNDVASPASIFGRLGRLTTPFGQIAFDGSFQRLDSVAEFRDSRPFTNQSRHVLENRLLRAQWRGQPFPSVGSQVSVIVSHGQPVTGDRVGIGRDDIVLRRDMSSTAVDGTGELTMALGTRDAITVGSDFNRTFHRLPSYFNQFISGNRQGEETPAGAAGDALVFNNLGLYTQGIWHPTDEQNVTLGLRLDDHSVYGPVWNARLGFVTPLTQGLVAKLLYGSSFMAPSPQQLFARSLIFGDVLGNQQLKPERAQTVEAALYWQPSRFLECICNAYLMRLTDRIGFVSEAGNARAVNQNALDAIGLESELKWRAGILHGTLNAAIQTAANVINPAEATVIGLDVLNLREPYPTGTLNLGIGAPLGLWSLHAYLEARYVTAIPATQTNYYANGRVAYELPGYGLIDATLSRREWQTPWGPLMAQFKVSNALDAVYAQPGFGGIDYPGRGRAWMVRMGYVF